MALKHGPNDEALVLEENLPDVPHLQGKPIGSPWLFPPLKSLEVNF